ncbi:MAG: hypothetical protein LBQ83_07685 [Candidatus Margulisbacteria bacterium]|jgi:hypothetical protein|nr:hypothetical protein [Candidatus Margulisiibacteriota bacterium]
MSEVRLPGGLQDWTVQLQQNNSQSVYTKIFENLTSGEFQENFLSELDLETQESLKNLFDSTSPYEVRQILDSLGEEGLQEVIKAADAAVTKLVLTATNNNGLHVEAILDKPGTRENPDGSSTIFAEKAGVEITTDNADFYTSGTLTGLTLNEETGATSIQEASLTGAHQGNFTYQTTAEDITIIGDETRTGKSVSNLETGDGTKVVVAADQTTIIHSGEDLQIATENTRAATGDYWVTVEKAAVQSGEETTGAASRINFGGGDNLTGSASTANFYNPQPLDTTSPENALDTPGSTIAAQDFYLQGNNFYVKAGEAQIAQGAAQTEADLKKLEGGYRAGEQSAIFSADTANAATAQRLSESIQAPETLLTRPGDLAMHNLDLKGEYKRTPYGLRIEDLAIQTTEETASGSAAGISGAYGADLTAKIDSMSAALHKETSEYTGEINGLKVNYQNISAGIEQLRVTISPEEQSLTMRGAFFSGQNLGGLDKIAGGVAQFSVTNNSAEFRLQASDPFVAINDALAIGGIPGLSITARLDKATARGDFSFGNSLVSVGSSGVLAPDTMLDPAQILENLDWSSAEVHTGNIGRTLGLFLTSHQGLNRALFAAGAYLEGVPVHLGSGMLRNWLNTDPDNFNSLLATAVDINRATEGELISRVNRSLSDYFRYAANLHRDLIEPDPSAAVIYEDKNFTLSDQNQTRTLHSAYFHARYNADGTGGAALSTKANPYAGASLGISTHADNAPALSIAGVDFYPNTTITANLRLLGLSLTAGAAFGEVGLAGDTIRAENLYRLANLYAGEDIAGYIPDELKTALDLPFTPLFSLGYESPRTEIADNTYFYFRNILTPQLNLRGNNDWARLGNFFAGAVLSGNLTTGVTFGNLQGKPRGVTAGLGLDWDYAFGQEANLPKLAAAFSLKLAPDLLLSTEVLAALAENNPYSGSLTLNLAR